MRSHPHAHLAVLCSALLAGSTSADVHVVDSNGFGDFTDIQAAVDAAADGDTILVQRPPRATSRYPGFVIDGKAISIVGPESQPLPTGPVVVRGLAPGKNVVLSSLDVNVSRVGLVTLQPEVAYAVGLTLEDNDGTVVLQDLHVAGTRFSDFDEGHGTTALEVSRCPSVVLRGCELIGGLGYGPGSGGAGIEVGESEIALYDSEVRGGEGGGGRAFEPEAYGGDGGAALRVASGSIYVASCELEGGWGGSALYGLYASYGGDGGTGIEVAAGAAAWLVETDFIGGLGGFAWTIEGHEGRPSSGPFVEVDGTPPELSAPTRAPESSAVSVVVRGEPGETVTLLESRSAVSRFQGPRAGVSHAGFPPRELRVGILPASGELDFDYTTPDAPTGEAESIFLQARLTSPGGTRLSELVHVRVLDGLEEPRCSARIHVDADALPGGDGSSWANAFTDLQQGLDATPDCAEHGASVWVAEGTYRPADRAGFFVYPGSHVFGGFEGTETRLVERDPAAHPVTLDGDLAGDDGPGFTFREDNAYHVVSLGNRAFASRNVRLDGFHVRGGSGDASYPHDPRGGGVYATGSSSIVRCLIEDNQSENGGGGGGGIYGLADTISIESCRIIANRGGGLYTTGTTYGSGTVRIDNSVFAGNVGRAITASLDVLDIRSSCFFANENTFAPAGVNFGPSDTTVSNSIFWRNPTLTGDPAQLRSLAGSGDLQIDYSVVQGLDGSLGGVGNLGEWPGFVAGAGPDGIRGTLDDDLHLRVDSPCVDAGSNADIAQDTLDLDGDGDTSEPLPFDLDGLPRFVDEPTVPDTGEGSPPIVDIGPYERPGP